MRSASGRSPSARARAPTSPARITAGSGSAIQATGFGLGFVQGRRFDRGCAPGGHGSVPGHRVHRARSGRGLGQLPGPQCHLLQLAAQAVPLPVRRQALREGRREALHVDGGRELEAGTAQALEGAHDRRPGRGPALRMTLSPAAGALTLPRAPVRVEEQDVVLQRSGGRSGHRARAAWGGPLRRLPPRGCAAGGPPSGGRHPPPPDRGGPPRTGPARPRRSRRWRPAPALRGRERRSRPRCGEPGGAPGAGPWPARVPCASTAARFRGGAWRWRGRAAPPAGHRRGARGAGKRERSQETVARGSRPRGESGQRPGQTRIEQGIGAHFVPKCGKLGLPGRAWGPPEEFRTWIVVRPIRGNEWRVIAPPAVPAPRQGRPRPLWRIGGPGLPRRRCHGSDPSDRGRRGDPAPVPEPPAGSSATRWWGPRPAPAA